MMRLLTAVAIMAAAFGTAHAQSTPTREVATFAGGCFWCTEADFDKVEGVISTTSGFIGGQVANPGYQQVTTGTTGHTEAVEIVFNPAKVTYRQLLDVFWHNHDPLTKDRQFCDRGNMYRPGIFFHSEAQREQAEGSKTQAQSRFAPRLVQTEITKATTFYKAEDYHQNYHQKNPVRYKLYRYNCGRDQRLEELWGKSDKSS